jgi:hypothetical protein
MKTIGMLTIGVVIGAWYSFVAWQLWAWFAMPLGAPALTFAHAFGLYVLAASVLLWGISPDVKMETEEAVTLVMGKANVAAIILLEGYVAHLFMK